VESGRSTRPASSKTMNLIGSRPTLIVNLCALAVAAVLTMEATYIVHERLGYYLPLDSLAFLFPALVMFIVRNRNFSFFFLALYIAVLVHMSAQARGIYLGVYTPGPEKGGPLGLLPPFFLLSAFCLAMYAAGASIRLLKSVFPPGN
jgi:hypothetical protein